MNKNQILIYPMTYKCTSKTNLKRMKPQQQRKQSTK